MSSLRLFFKFCTRLVPSIHLQLTIKNVNNKINLNSKCFSSPEHYTCIIIFVSEGKYVIMLFAVFIIGHWVIVVVVFFFFLAV